MTKPELHISKRLTACLPPLSDKEKKQLEANIIADGEVLDPILYWNDGKRNVVIDGMHRWAIVRRLKLGNYTAKEVKTIGPNYEDAAQWVFDHYDGQRHQTREAIGKWYNDAKASWGGDRQSKPTNDGLKNTADTIAGKAGVSARTVERNGARVAALEKCTPAVQKGVASDTLKLSDADVNTLSKLPAKEQSIIASDLRKGLAKTVTESMEGQGIAMPAPKKPKKKKKPSNKPPKKFDKPALYRQWESTIGPLVRLVDKIASDVGEKEGESHRAIRGQLEACTDEMQEWMEIA